MKGVYRFYQHGKLIAEHENLLTTAGRNAITRYLAGQIPNLGEAIAYGTSATTELITDTLLGFEVERIIVDLKSADITNNTVVFKCTIPQESVCRINEIGLWTTLDNDLSGEFQSRLMTTFDTEIETWTNSTLDTTNYRIGVDALRIDATASSTTQTRTDVTLDLSGYSSSDAFRLAFTKTTNNISTIKLVFANLAGGQFSQTVTVSGLGLGYNVISFPKSGFTATGSVNWDTIERFGFDVTAGGTGGFVSLDGLRVEDLDSTNNEYALISHSTFGIAVVKDDTAEMDVEYALGF